MIVADQYLIARVQARAGAQIHEVAQVLAAYVGYASLQEEKYSTLLEEIERCLRRFLATGILTRPEGK